ncbi:hypothetical protein Y032_0559g3440 [Ancylostoma ceylanicum]|uniref:FFD box profile domain-containing protein n=1 Tax=Ancylostoma ceylanicum TaxID=53326 RepID=A0A016WQY2_9BILA|nr:hypothetical protein Y032_0559g3440 [Ancylostoma ceylanicum]
MINLLSSLSLFNSRPDNSAIFCKRAEVVAMKIAFCLGFGKIENHFRLRHSAKPRNTVKLKEQNFPQPVGSGNRQYNNGYLRGGYNNYGGQRPRNNQSVGVPRPREKLKFDGDYDFEKANEQFQEQFSDMFKDKLKVDGEKSEEEQGEKAPEDTYYDKKSSFFDRISCEALEKAEGKSGRPDWKKERETNQETFGHSAVRSLNYRRGFGQRGRGGRGYGSRF